MKKICICGGGNLGHVVAGFLAAHGDCEVSLLTRHPERWQQQLEITTPAGTILQGAIGKITSDPKDVIPQADIVLLCLPGFSIREVLQQIAPALTSGTAVGSIVSSTGFFFEAFKILPKDTPLFGFQRVPFISRIIEYGRKVELKGYKESLHVAIEHSVAKEDVRETLEQLFEKPVTLAENFYEVSLSNSNPLLHPARLYTMWGDWQPGIVYPRNPQFYAEWTLEASTLLLQMDEELQQLLPVLGLPKGCIPPILDYYEATDAESLTQKLRSIKAFQGILSPMKAVEDGFVPDVSSRYFTEDFPYGMRFIVETAKQYHAAIPTISKIYQWGLNIINQKNK
jgi:hypothetical protein